jgi:hypothetical protein
LNFIEGTSVASSLTLCITSRWLIKHGPDDYKTGKQYGERPPMVIAPFIYPELEAFIDVWRQELRPTTKKLFCKPRTGEPLDEVAMYTTFKNAALKWTGKATNPHLVRDMIVTHLRSVLGGGCLAVHVACCLYLLLAVCISKVRLQMATRRVWMMHACHAHLLMWP